MEPAALGLLTAAEAARRLGVRVHQVLRAIRAGRLTAVRLGHYWCVVDDERLAAFAAALEATAKKRERIARRIHIHWRAGLYADRRKSRFVLMAKVTNIALHNPAVTATSAPDALTVICPRCQHPLWATARAVIVKERAR